jgi:hypothetical protein
MRTSGKLQVMKLDEMPMELLQHILDLSPPCRLRETSVRLSQLSIPKWQCAFLLQAALATQSDPIVNVCEKTISGRGYDLQTFGEDALQAALKANAKRLVRALWSRRCDLSERRFLGWVGMVGAVYALQHNEEAIVRDLVERGFFRDARYTGRWMDFVRQGGEWAEYHQALMRGSPDALYFCAAVVGGNVESVQSVVECGVPVSPVGLLLALQQQNVRMARWIVEEGRVELSSDEWTRCVYFTVTSQLAQSAEWLAQACPLEVRVDSLLFILAKGSPHTVRHFMRGLQESAVSEPLVWFVSSSYRSLCVVSSVLCEIALSPPTAFRVLSAALSYSAPDPLDEGALIADAIHALHPLSLDQVAALSSLRLALLSPKEHHVALASWLRRVHWLSAHGYTFPHNLELALLYAVTEPSLLSPPSGSTPFYQLVLACKPPSTNPSILIAALNAAENPLVLHDLLNFGFKPSPEFKRLLKQKYPSVYKHWKVPSGTASLWRCTSCTL